MIRLWKRSWLFGSQGGYAKTEERGCCFLAALKQHKDARAQRKKKPEKNFNNSTMRKKSQLQQLDKVHVTIMSGKMPTDNGNRPLKQPGAGGKLKCKHSTIKEERRRRSADLQQRLFVHYSFINAEGRYKSLSEIFDVTEDKTPPSGAGNVLHISCCNTPTYMITKCWPWVNLVGSYPSFRGKTAWPVLSSM